MDIAHTATWFRHKLLSRYEAWRDGALDRRYGVDTGCARDPAADAPAWLQAYHGYHYEPIQIGVFRRIVEALPLDAVDLTFVDFGCGKGRALLLAAEHGFRRIVGIECDGDLLAAARRNISTYCAAARRPPDIELHLGDAVKHELPPEDCLCFFYNPFDEVAMANVLARIGRSLKAKPRRLLVVYRNPRHSDLMRRAGFLRHVVRNRSFEVYAATTT